MREIDWRKCYGQRWSGIIVDEAFCHPAKFSRALIHRIYAHAFEQGWLKAGDSVADPFGGVALGALEAMRRGLHWRGCELELRFVELGQQNIDLWHERYSRQMPGWGSAVLVQGDSRELANVFAEAGVVVSSPPYATKQMGGGGDTTKTAGGYRVLDAMKANYGHTPGQLGNMPEGDYDDVVSSPPFRGWHKGTVDRSSMIPPEEQRLGKGAFTSAIISDGYGHTPGQLGQESGDSFWSAARAIVGPCYQILRPGAVAIWVCKDFVRKGKIVPFCDQWLQLCQSVGFEPLEWVRAWLVEDRGAQYDIFGNLQKRTVERKSFFRRLAEQKGSPRIDHEVVIVVRKP